MTVLKLIRGAAVVLATAGIVLPISTLQASESQKSAKRTAATVAADVCKLKDGSFAGRVVDHTGAVVDNAEVVVRQSNKEIARGFTNDEGMFTFKNLKPGSYQVSSGTTEGLFRVWNEQAAPPSARKNALIVLGNNGARGQYAACDDCPPGGWGGFPGLDPTICLLAAGVIAAVVLGIIALEKLNTLQDDVNKIPVSP